MKSSDQGELSDLDIVGSNFSQAAAKPSTSACTVTKKKAAAKKSVHFTVTTAPQEVKKPIKGKKLLSRQFPLL